MRKAKLTFLKNRQKSVFKTLKQNLKLPVWKKEFTGHLKRGNSLKKIKSSIYLSIFVEDDGI